MVNQMRSSAPRLENNTSNKSSLGKKNKHKGSSRRRSQGFNPGTANVNHQALIYLKQSNPNSNYSSQNGANKKSLKKGKGYVKV
mmetsp:Transcript_13121/g.20381  ORF Transcript_13121/g.20381 Transcript_13121/m.20381 type:complete len:84 (-) Transcript_13121:352-603(-)